MEGERREYMCERIRKTGQKSEGQALQMDDGGIINLRLYRSGYGIELSIVDCWSDDV